MSAERKERDWNGAIGLLMLSLCGLIFMLGEAAAFAAIGQLVTDGSMARCWAYAVLTTVLGNAAGAFLIWMDQRQPRSGRR